MATGARRRGRLEIARAALAARFIPGGAGWAPILDVADYLARTSALRVLEVRLPTSIGAALAVGPDGRPTLAVNRRLSLGERNFNAAHEFGHWVLHRSTRSGEPARTERRRLEWEADWFATELLLPPRLVSDWAGLARTPLRELALRLGVPPRLVRRRIADLAPPPRIRSALRRGS